MVECRKTEPDPHLDVSAGLLSLAGCWQVVETSYQKGTVKPPRRGRFAAGHRVEVGSRDVSGGVFLRWLWRATSGLYGLSCRRQIGCRS